MVLQVFDVISGEKVEILSEKAKEIMDDVLHFLINK